MYVVICVVSLCYGEGDGFLTVFLVVKVKVVLFPSIITISKSTEGEMHAMYSNSKAISEVRYSKFICVAPFNNKAIQSALCKIQKKHKAI